MIRCIIFASLLVFLNFLASIATVSAQEPALTPPVPDEFRPSIDYYLAEVTQVLSEEQKELAGNTQLVQTVKVRLTRGEEKGKELQLEGHIVSQESQKVKEGDKVVVVKNTLLSGDHYYIADKYRLTSFIPIFAIFFVAAIFFARIKGLTAILGLGVSLLILVQFVIPRILSGSNPLIISLLGAVSIAVLSLYLAHGYNRRTSIALLSTLLTLGIAMGLAFLFVSLAKLTGLGSDEAFYLQIGPIDQLNLRGLLLGGIIIGALGVLDDVTTSQVAAVAEIQQANPKLPFIELYRRGLRVGQEHITSLVNTLVLAYAGASFPLLLLFTLNQEMPLWVKLNNEIIAEEIIRTLVGSTALIFAVPIATFFAAFFLEGRTDQESLPTHAH